MPIEFSCPFCSTPYRLRDDLAGKRAKCKNAACQQMLQGNVDSARLHLDSVKRQLLRLEPDYRD